MCLIGLFVCYSLVAPVSQMAEVITSTAHTVNGAVDAFVDSWPLLLLKISIVASILSCMMPCMCPRHEVRTTETKVEEDPREKEAYNTIRAIHRDQRTKDPETESVTRTALAYWDEAQRRKLMSDRFPFYIFEGQFNEYWHGRAF